MKTPVRFYWREELEALSVPRFITQYSTAIGVCWLDRAGFVWYGGFIVGLLAVVWVIQRRNLTRSGVRATR